jgi:transcriptional regulator with PAS, ATPase and Fis domain
MKGRRVFDDRGSTQLKSARPLARLRTRPEITWTDEQGERRALLDARVVVGASSEATIVLRDSTVSRLHAELAPQDDGLWVRDLGSKNGTFVNGVRVTGALALDGALIELGGTRLTVRYAPDPTRVELWPFDSFGQLIGASDAMRELFARLAKVAASDATVMIMGETGTGKDLVAREIHAASPRAKEPFVVVDCAALPESLLESEVFGHVRGSFTGAHAAKLGAIEAAEGGTIFFDEIGELPLPLQPKLLRVLESKTVRRIGETTHRQIDVRFISATHRDLLAMTNAGAFREDLYFRLSVLPIVVPPLRERVVDVDPLVRRFLGDRPALDDAIMAEVRSRPWLGNARELRNFVERAVTLGADNALALERASMRPAPTGTSEEELPQRWLDRPLRDAREAVDRAYLRALMARHRHVGQAAEAAGVDRTYLYRLLRKYDLG